MSAQVKIFSGGDNKNLQEEINAFLKKKGLERNDVTIKQSQSTFPTQDVGRFTTVVTITLLYDEKV
jgi:hypothetical protein